MLERWAAVAAVMLLFGASIAAAADTPPPCLQYKTKPIRVGRAPASLPELSGLAASRRHPGVYWGENDSGNPFELFAMREDGTLVAHFPLTGGTNIDSEDLGLGPCQQDRKQTCLYLADIGDNLERREHVVVYEIPEPATLDERPLAARALRFRYDDHPHNAEALFVDPDDARLYVVTKEIDSLGALYRLDGLGEGKTGHAVRLFGMSAPAGFGGLTTGGAVHPSGTRALLRTYTQVWEYRGLPQQSLAAILATTPVAVPDARQPQGEAITYTSDGRGYLMGSELTAPLYRVDCAE